MIIMVAPAATTPVALDIEGHERSITDARGVVTAAHVPEMLGHMVLARSSDAGETPTVAVPSPGTLAATSFGAHSMRCSARFAALRSSLTNHAIIDPGSICVYSQS